MKRIYDFLISKPLMGGLLLLLAVAMGVATFIENDFGTNAARSLVYNAWWFELAFLILAISLFGNLIKFRLWKMKHFAVTLFHLSFFIIIVGAAITRYYSYEGMMHIREGSESNSILTTEAFVDVSIKKGESVENKTHHVLFSAITPNEVEMNFDNDVTIESTLFIPNATTSPVESPDGQPYLILVGTEMNGRVSKTLTLNERTQFGDLKLAFETNDTLGVNFNIKMVDGALQFNSAFPVMMMQMQSGKVDTFKAGLDHPFYSGVLYQIGESRLVLKSFMEKAVLFPQYQPEIKGLPDAVVLNVKMGDQSKQLIVMGSKGLVGDEFSINIGDVEVSATYGSLPIELPFSIHLNDFILERYPGSHSPSSFASEVTLKDEVNNVNENKRIFMNNILNYKGYRFYQSSYDEDEKGTVLSVNHDFIGTVLTYIGYFLLSLGMILALIMPNTRFRALYRRTVEISAAKKGLVSLFLIVLSTGLMAQDANPPHAISPEMANAFGQLWVQDNDGRIKPMNTMNSELARKLVKHNSFKGLNSDQLILSLMIDRDYWHQYPMITVKSEELRMLLKVDGPKASFKQFFAGDGSYVLGKMVEDAYRKKPSDQNKLEQELIKIDEQVNIFYLTQVGRFLKLFPNPIDTHQPWLTPEDFPRNGYTSQDSLFVRNAIPLYLNCIVNGKIDLSHEYLSAILKYQNKYAAPILPSETHKAIEVFYNNANLFMMLMPFLMVLGALLLIMQFITLLYPRYTLPLPNKIGSIIFILAFVVYTIGLGMRWYISGHAPWSNGYESMLYIGWATFLAGLVFAKRNPIVASVSGLFTSIILMVAHLSWMNPEITNLVPVLKSYWLTIHVAIIVASYGFLGLGALLSFLNLIIMGVKNPKNRGALSLTIEELSAICEMSLTVGLYMLTIGAFLGGVWANESWGRYWGWDAKETWSMVTILIYAFVLHMRLIPGMKSLFTFNLWSLLGFASVVMTYLGVNYYLAGLHSYAKGDPVPVPVFVYYTVFVIAVVSVYAAINEQKMRKLD